MKPQRIQRKRIPGYNMQEESRKLNGLPAVSVCRPGRWGNKFKVGDSLLSLPPVVLNRIVFSEEEQECGTITNEIAKVAFRIWLNYSSQGKGRIEMAKAELRGKNLACFCNPADPCHADVWLEIANQ